VTSTFQGVSEVTKQPEQGQLTMVVLPGNRLFYILGVAPQNEMRVYGDVLRRIRQSVRFSE
jgi:hypothetical protein